MWLWGWAQAVPSVLPELAMGLAVTNPVQRLSGRAMWIVRSQPPAAVLVVVQLMRHPM